MKQITTVREAWLKASLQSFAELGIARKVPSLPSAADLSDCQSEPVKAPRRDPRASARRNKPFRPMRRTSLAFPPTVIPYLDGKRQNTLVEKIIDEFCPRFTAGGTLVYVRGAGEGRAYFDQDFLENLGVFATDHAKMPDVVVYIVRNDWLCLVDAVTSHGLVGKSRLAEMLSLFACSRAGLVFVTAVVKRRDLSKFAGDIAWGTSVWAASDPDHLIHFDGPASTDANPE